MKSNNILLMLVAVLTLYGCGGAVRPIEYGVDDCHFCQMRIMDPRFGAEAVTQKGRVYLFDSSECLLRYVLGNDQPLELVLVTDYLTPRKLISALDAHYLVSDNMPSPMGGYLNAFASHEEAKQYREKNGGELFTWTEMQKQYQE